MRPLQNPHFWRISSLCAARKLAYLSDISALSVLLSLRTALKSGVLQRSQVVSRKACHTRRVGISFYPLITGDENHETDCRVDVSR
ncbi:hypothetical protein CRG49_003170 [Neisseria sp. N95_16]|nr:hypothetical protein CRG49_003170 [Neisseria sp. N95_16]